MFGLCESFVYTDEELPILFPEYREDVTLSSTESERWAWLSELAVCSELVPNLESIEIEESTGGFRTIKYSGFDWDLPEELKRVFETRGVDLRAWLRKPASPDPYVYRDARVQERDT